MFFIVLSEIFIGLFNLFLKYDLLARLIENAVEVASAMDSSPHIETIEGCVFFTKVNKALTAQLEDLDVVGEDAPIFLLLLFLLSRKIECTFSWIVRLELEGRGNVKHDVEVAEPAFFEELDQLDSDCLTIALVEETVKVARAL